MRRRVLAVAGAGGASVLGLLLAGGYVWLNQPVSSKGTPQVMTAKTSGQSMLPLETALFSSQVDNMSRRNLPSGTSNALARLLAGSVRPIDGDQLAITVNKLPPAGFRDVSDITMRRVERAVYSEVSLPDLPTGAIAFRAIDRYEVSVFWLHDDTYAAIVLSGRPDRAAQLEHHLSVVLSNWQWL